MISTYLFDKIISAWFAKFDFIGSQSRRSSDNKIEI